MDFKNDTVFITAHQGHILGLPFSAILTTAEHIREGLGRKTNGSQEGPEAAES